MQLKGPGGKGEAQMAVNELAHDCAQLRQHRSAMEAAGCEVMAPPDGGDSGSSGGDVRAASPTTGSSPGKRLLGRTGEAVKGAWSWLRGRSGSDAAKAQPPLHCQLTYINVPWDSIVTDMAWPAKKK